MSFLWYPSPKEKPIASLLGMGGGIGSKLLGGEGLPTVIGQFALGGYFAGYYSSTQNRVATDGLIVAPAASGYYGNGNSTRTHSQATSYCNNLSIGGYDDWFLPNRHELEIAYYNLKPTTDSNETSIHPDAGSGNSYAVPSRSGQYTSGTPGQTSVSDFQSGGSEAFKTSGNGATHWSSTTQSDGDEGTEALRMYFLDGDRAFVATTAEAAVRAFRKFSLS
jgi:hypothetical protein